MPYKDKESDWSPIRLVTISLLWTLSPQRPLLDKDRRHRRLNFITKTETLYCIYSKIHREPQLSKFKLVSKKYIHPRQGRKQCCISQLSPFMGNNTP